MGKMPAWTGVAHCMSGITPSSEARDTLAPIHASLARRRRMPLEHTKRAASVSG